MRGRPERLAEMKRRVACIVLLLAAAVASMSCGGPKPPPAVTVGQRVTERPDAVYESRKDLHDEMVRASYVFARRGRKRVTSQGMPGWIVEYDPRGILVKEPLPWHDDWKALVFKHGYQSATLVYVDSSGVCRLILEGAP